MKHKARRTRFSKFFRLRKIKIPRPLRKPLAALLKLASDPAPEVLDEKQQVKCNQRPDWTSWIWLPLIAILSAVGLFLIAYVYSHTRNEGPAKLRMYFYPGLLLMYTPMAVRILVPSTSRAERLILICMSGIICYLIKPLTSPLHFYLYDEFLHWRTANDITASTHLFTPNSLLPVSPYYPGLENVTSAFSMLSGLDVFHTSLILVGICRLLMTLSLFALNEELFQSSRIASIAVIIYMVNAHYIFFDTQYAYESLALPLAIFLLYLMSTHQAMSWLLVRLRAMNTSRLELASSSPAKTKAQYTKLKGERRAMTFMALIVMSAIIFTHHATSFLFLGLIGLWGVIYAYLRITSLKRSHLLWLAFTGVILAIAWVNAPNNPVIPYLTGFLSSIFAKGGKHFTAAVQNGYSTMAWEKNLAQYATYFTILCLPFGWLVLWQRFRTNALAWLMGVTSFGLVAIQGLKTSDNGIQLADRAAVIIYIGVGSVLAIMIAQYWPRRSLNWLHISIIAVFLSLFFMSSYILSGGSGYGSPPTPYVVGADSRSLDVRSIQAAVWMQTYLGSGNRVGTDRTNQLLMATYGNQRIVDSIADHVDIAPAFFSDTLDAPSLAILKQGNLEYLVMDKRLATSPPIVGSYIEKSEPGAFQHFSPVSLNALMKFDAVPKINKVFDDGEIVIFDVRELVHGH